MTDLRRKVWTGLGEKVSTDVGKVRLDLTMEKVPRAAWRAAVSFILSFDNSLRAFLCGTLVL